jgi:hypothetical protein
MRHHMVQEKGRSEILLDYHLRVGQVTHDTCVPDGQIIEEQRLDETEVGAILLSWMAWAMRLSVSPTMP